MFINENLLVHTTCLAVASDPALVADLLAVDVTAVVTKLVVARSAELRARCVVVVLVTQDAYLVAYQGRTASVNEGLPVEAWQDDARVVGSVYQRVYR